MDDVWLVESHSATGVTATWHRDKADAEAVAAENGGEVVLARWRSGNTYYTNHAIIELTP